MNVRPEVQNRGISGEIKGHMSTKTLQKKDMNVRVGTVIFTMNKIQHDCFKRRAFK